MHKPLWSLMLIVFTMTYVPFSVARTTDNTPVPARIVTVQRADVHQVAAITGRLSYADESIAYSPAAGVVSRISVKDGQRVGQGEALIRLDLGQEEILTAFSQIDLPGEYAIGDLAEQVSMDNAVIRAEQPCTVRQVLIAENSSVAAGTPVLRLSSNQQEIICTAAASEAEHIAPGMWAWLSAEGESLGFAQVHSVGELAADPLTGLTAASITLHPEQHIELPEGASINADVYLAGSDDVLSLPMKAITPRGTVWWVSDGRCTEIPAEIVMTDELHAWVSLPEGLPVAIGEFTEGQRIVEADE